jgi:hypothetical protein
MNIKVTTVDPLTLAESEMHLELYEFIRLLQHWQSDYSNDRDICVFDENGTYTFNADNGQEYTVYDED